MMSVESSTGRLVLTELGPADTTIEVVTGPMVEATAEETVAATNVGTARLPEGVEEEMTGASVIVAPEMIKLVVVEGSTGLLSGLMVTIIGFEEIL